MALPEMKIKEVVDKIVRSVFGLRDFLEYHLPFAINFLGREDGFEENVGEQFSRHFNVFTEHLGVIAGVLLAGKSIEHTPDRINLLGNLGCASPPRSLE